MKKSPQEKLRTAKTVKQQVEGLRGIMGEQAEKISMPDRFVTKSIPDTPRVRVTDTLTGKTLEVGLCDYFGVRKALGAFF